jgi:hypothetical protein
MAKVLRQDTKQLLGYLIELDGPIQPWIKEWPFRAWHHPDGKLRDFPPAPTDGRMLVPPHLELGIPIRTSPSGELEILGREPINLPGRRLARVRYASIATKFCSAAK